MSKKQQDRELGDALSSALPTPDHRDDYFERLRDELANATKPSEVDRTKATRRSLKWYWMPAGAVAAAVLAVLMIASQTRTESPVAQQPPTTPTPSAVPELSLAQVVARKTSAEWRTLSGFQAVIDETAIENGKTEHNKFEVRVRSNGDYWSRKTSLDSATKERVLFESAYRATAGEYDVMYRNPEPLTSALERYRGIPDGRYSVPVLSGLSSAVRSLVAASDPAVKELTYEGKPAWEVILDKNFGGYGPEAANHAVVIVDQQLGFPVSVKLSRDGKPVQALTVRELVINPTFSDDQFTVARINGVELGEIQDSGFARTTLNQVSKAVGYAPFVVTPEYEGFKISTVSTSKRGFNALGGVEDKNVVSITYRRGLESFTVTTRMSGAEVAKDPLNYLEGNVTQSGVSLNKGPFSGPAEYVMWEAGSYSYIWAAKGGMILTVTGDLALNEMQTIAESLVQQQ